MIGYNMYHLLLRETEENDNIRSAIEQWEWYKNFGSQIVVRDTTATHWTDLNLHAECRV